MFKTKLQEEKYQWRKSLESFQSLAPKFLPNKILSECCEKIEEDLFCCQKKDSGSNQKGNFVNMDIVYLTYDKALNFSSCSNM